MKQLIRKLSRVANSSHYTLLRSNSVQPRCAYFFCHKRVPKGYVPVYVGEEMKRFVVKANLLNHPMIVNLLNQSAEKYGYKQKGVLRIPCHVFEFEQVLEAIPLGPLACDSGDIDDLHSSSFE